jgi:hypothetical protein
MRKSFKTQNPAFNFISIPEEGAETVHTDDDKHADDDVYNDNDATADTNDDAYADVYTNNPIPKETKTRRLQLLLKPSTYEQLKQFADSRQVSVNDVVNTVLTAFLKNDSRRNEN